MSGMMAAVQAQNVEELGINAPHVGRLSSKLLGQVVRDLRGPESDGGTYIIQALDAE